MQRGETAEALRRLAAQSRAPAPPISDQFSREIILDELGAAWGEVARAMAERDEAKGVLAALWWRHAPAYPGYPTRIRLSGPVRESHRNGLVCYTCGGPYPCGDAAMINQYFHDNRLRHPGDREHWRDDAGS